MNHCRPSIDVLFQSAAAVFGGNVLAVVLTGMGHDGRDGADALQQQGAHIIVQDQKSSTVWGMPGSVSDAGFANEIVALDDVAGAIMRATDNRSGFRRSS